MTKLTRRSLIAAFASLPVVGKLVSCKAELLNHDNTDVAYPDAQGIVEALWKAEHDIMEHTGTAPAGYLLGPHDWHNYHFEVFSLHHQFLPVTYRPPGPRTTLEFGGIPIHCIQPGQWFISGGSQFQPRAGHVTAWGHLGGGLCSTQVAFVPVLRGPVAPFQ